ncbi:hypothetical protein B0H17DRAFT_1333023, partial [Mycena rosella]
CVSSSASRRAIRGWQQRWSCGRALSPALGQPGKSPHIAASPTGRVSAWAQRISEPQTRSLDVQAGYRRNFVSGGSCCGGKVTHPTRVDVLNSVTKPRFDSATNPCCPDRQISRIESDQLLEAVPWEYSAGAVYFLARPPEGHLHCSKSRLKCGPLIRSPLSGAANLFNFRLIF